METLRQEYVKKVNCQLKIIENRIKDIKNISINYQNDIPNPNFDVDYELTTITEIESNIQDFKEMIND